MGGLGDPFPRNHTLLMHLGEGKQRKTLLSNVKAPTGRLPKYFLPTLVNPYGEHVSSVETSTIP